MTQIQALGRTDRGIAKLLSDVKSTQGELEKKLMGVFDGKSINAYTIPGKVRLSTITAQVHFDNVLTTGENIPDIGPMWLCP